MILIISFITAISATADTDVASISEVLSPVKPVAGPLTSNAVKIRVLDSFKGKTAWHGKTVVAALKNLFVAQNNVLNNNVEISSANVVDEAKKTATKNIKPLNVTQDEFDEELAIIDFLMGLRKAGEEGVKIVNYSLVDKEDTGGNNFEYKEIVSILEKYDMILVVPSGNEGESGSNRYPCSYNHPQIVCVAAGTRNYVLTGTHEDGIIYEKYSNDLSTVRFVTYGSFFETYGTSFASPRVASALGFIWGQNPKLKSTQVINYLRSYGKFVDTTYLSESMSLKKKNFLLETDWM